MRILIAAIGVVLMAALALSILGSPATPVSESPSIEAASSPSMQTPEAAEPLTGVALEGKKLFTDRGCAACHGTSAMGTAVVQSISLRSPGVITQQVRAPVGMMPPFPPDKLSSDELDKIIVFIRALPEYHAHHKPVDVKRDIALHQWMALLALEANDLPEAAQQMQHINGLSPGDPLPWVQNVLLTIAKGNIHDATHTVEATLAETAQTATGHRLTLEEIYLRLALSAMRVENIPGATHHIHHFVEIAAVFLEDSQSVLEPPQEGDLYYAENSLEQLVAATKQEEEPIQYLTQTMPIMNR